MKIKYLILLLAVFPLFSCEENNKPEEEDDFSGTSGTFTDDRDGEEYDWVRIGDQIWMAENLRTTLYNDGTPIPNVTSDDEWYEFGTPAYCWCDNLEGQYKIPYGTLYNWHAIYTGKLAPIGWHVPSKEEWETLLDFIGEGTGAGGELKETGTSHWLSPNTGATNSTGFTAVPAGRRTSDFDLFRMSAIFWSYSKRFSDQAWSLALEYNTVGSIITGQRLHHGCSVRCVKDDF